MFAPAQVKEGALLELAAISARVEGLRLQILASAGDVADRHGARSTAAWLGHATRADAPATARAGRLAAALDATCTATGRALRSGRVHLEQARAIVNGLEDLPSDVLPLHGGTATQIIVTIDHQRLRDETGVATLLDDGTRVTIGHLRRLACQAGILPAVLGGDSEVLDLGRSQRLFGAAQRKAAALRHPHCQAEGCRTPASWCQAHHRDPWSRGGSRDLADLELLCPWHHRRVHDPTYRVDRHPDGSLRFHRRS